MKQRYLIPFFAFLAVSAQQTLACSCMPPELPEAYAEHDVIFTGQVRRISKQFSMGSARFKQKVEIKPTKIYKGDTQKKLIVYTASDSAACGFPFEKKQDYAVFAYYSKSDMAKKPSKRKLQVSLCSPTTNLSDNKSAAQQEVLAFLNTGTLPSPMAKPATPLPLSDVEDDLALLMETNRKVREAFKRQDIASILQYHHPRVEKVISWNDTQLGHAGMEKALSKLFSEYNVTFLPVQDKANIEIFGDSAAMIRTFKLKGTPKTTGLNPFVFEGKTLIMYVRYPESPTGWVTAREMLMSASTN